MGNAVGDAVGYVVETPAHVVGNAVEEMGGEIFCACVNVVGEVVGDALRMCRRFDAYA